MPLRARARTRRRKPASAIRKFARQLRPLADVSVDHMHPMDSIATAYVAPLLQPGEVIRWVGCLMQPVSFNLLGVPQRYAHFVAVGTTGACS